MLITQRPGLDNEAMIVYIHLSKKNGKHFDYSYYITQIQRRAISTRTRCEQGKFPISKEIVHNPNSVDTFNCFEEENHVERYKCLYRLFDFTRNNLYDIAISDF